MMRLWCAVEEEGEVDLKGAEEERIEEGEEVEAAVTHPGCRTPVWLGGLKWANLGENCCFRLPGRKFWEGAIGFWAGIPPPPAGGGKDGGKKRNPG